MNTQRSGAAPDFDSLSVSASQARDLHVTTKADDNVTAILQLLEAEHRLFNVPIIIFLVFLAGFGISGNVCVLHVYRTRFRKTAGSFFIMALAVMDLLSAALCVPFDIFDLSYPYTHPAPVACRLFRFLEYWSTMAAGLTLTCVAFSRYFKIVRPFHCYSAGQARSLVIVMVAIALSVCWPQLVLSGTRTVPTRVPGVLGQDCSISDSVATTVYPLIFYSILLAVFFLCFSIMLAFYARIICVVWRRSRTRIGERVPSTTRPHAQRGKGGEGGGVGGQERTRSSIEARSPTGDPDLRRSSSEARSPTGHPDYRRSSSEARSPIEGPDHRRSSGELRSPSSSHASFSSSQLSIVSTLSKAAGHRQAFDFSTTTGRQQQQQRRRRRRRRSRGQPASYLGRTTRMLSLVTAVALLGYVPFLTVQLVAVAGAGFRASSAMSGYSEDMAMQVCLKSHYLSSAANPLIYSLLSPTFRKESMVALKQLLTTPLATLCARCRRRG